MTWRAFFCAVLFLNLVLGAAGFSRDSASFVLKHHFNHVNWHTDSNHGKTATMSQSRRVTKPPQGKKITHRLLAALSEADKDRLLFSEKGLTAFIVAEMRHFVNETMVEMDLGWRYGGRWSMPLEEKLQLGLIDNVANATIINDEYIQSSEMFKQNGSLAVEVICNTTTTAFQEGFRETGLLSALGSAILFFRNFYRTPTNIAACERIGISDYAVAHHITDMYHHRTWRGAYTKTLMASGKGEIAARLAVGIDTDDNRMSGKGKNTKENAEQKQKLGKDVIDERDEDDECLQWSPTTPGLCLHWKSDNEAWRKTRFERIQMEGTKDPRRGGSGTSR